MKRKIYSFFVVLTVFLTVLGFIGCASKPDTAANYAGQEFSTCTIISPYECVDWETWDQYKASLHIHTKRSDGGNTLAETIEELYRLNYDIVAITDHNVVNRDWTSGLDAVSQERYEEISAGAGRNNRKMLRIPNTNEQSNSDHVNTFFFNYNNSSAEEYSSYIKSANDTKAISRFNHPGRYTGAHSGGHEEAGVLASNRKENINKYARIFMQYKSWLDTGKCEKNK